MKRLALALLFIFWASAAFAQYAGLRVVATCGTPAPWPALQTNPLWLASTAWLTVDTNYNLCTTGGGGGGGGGAVNVTQWNSISLGNPTLWGTPPTGQIVPGMNVDVLSAPAPAPIIALHANTTALANNLNVKASSGTLINYNCTAITGGAQGYCVAYNAAATPGTGALTGANVLDSCQFDTTTRGCSLSRVSVGVNYATGIQILVTSAATPYTYTTGTDTAFISADYQ